MNSRFNPRTSSIENYVLPKNGKDGISIVGQQGPKGEPGENGKDGIDGQSIVGPQGPKGDRGEPGKNGNDGMSIVGPNGQNGKDGKSNLILKSAMKPNDKIGENNDWCFTDANEVYFKQNNSWQFFAQFNSGYSKRTIVGFIEAYLKAGIYFDMYFWENVSITKSLNLGIGTTTYPPLKFTSGPLLATPQAGALEYFEGHLYLTNGARHVIPTSAGVKITTTTVANTTTETTIYSYTFSSNEIHTDERIVARIDGVYSAATNTDAFTVRFKLAGVTHHSIIRTAKGTVVDVGFESTYSGTIRSLGVAGTFVDFSKLVDNDSVSCAGESTAHTIDTTSGFLFEITIQWNNAKTDNSLSCTQGEICFYH